MSEPTTTATGVAATKSYSLEDTRIEIAGVIRCCLQDVAIEYKDKPVELGYKSQCPHCKTRFTLIWKTTQRGNGYPLWKPDWQIADDAKAQRPS